MFWVTSQADMTMCLLVSADGGGYTISVPIRMRTLSCQAGWGWIGSVHVHVAEIEHWHAKFWRSCSSSKSEMQSSTDDWPQPCVCAVDCEKRWRPRN